jgi:hypothetical protein
MINGKNEFLMLYFIVRLDFWPYVIIRLNFWPYIMERLNSWPYFMVRMNFWPYIMVRLNFWPYIMVRLNFWPYIQTFLNSSDRAGRKSQGKAILPSMPVRVSDKNFCLCILFCIGNATGMPERSRSTRN